MKLTTRGRYAVTAMLDLALHGGQGAVPLAEVSLRQEISQAYLEQLFVRLRRQKLVKSVRGPGGGYLLAREAADISLAEIIRAVDETVDATRCGGWRDCQGQDNPCLTHELWEELSRTVLEFLSRTTLGDLVQRHHVRAVSRRQDRAMLLRQSAGRGEMQRASE